MVSCSDVTVVRRRSGKRKAPAGIEPAHTDSKSVALSTELRGRDHKSRAETEGVADGARTRDHRDHNPGLYQLSYRHRAG